MKYHPNTNRANSGDGSAVRYYTKDRHGQFQLFAPKKNYRLILPVLGVALAIFLLFASYSWAQEIISSEGLICDTPEQVAEIIVEKDVMSAIIRVNTAAGSNACAVGKVSFFEGEVVAHASGPDGEVEIKSIMIIGYTETDGSLVMMPAPLVQYTPYLVIPKTSI